MNIMKHMVSLLVVVLVAFISVKEDATTQVLDVAGSWKILDGELPNRNQTAYLQLELSGKFSFELDRGSTAEVAPQHIILGDYELFDWPEAEVKSMSARGGGITFNVYNTNYRAYWLKEVDSDFMIIEFLGGAPNSFPGVMGLQRIRGQPQG